MRFTHELMRDLNTCGSYYRAFCERFPTSEYPDGVEVTAEVCAANADAFDWQWAASTLLNDAGEREWNQLTSGTPGVATSEGYDERLARAFGELFERPELRSLYVIERYRAAEERRERDVVNAVAHAESQAKHARDQLAVWTVEAPKLEAELTELRRTHAAQLLRIADRRVAEAEESLRLAHARRGELAQQATDTTTTTA
jgi:hypothetical protein